MQLGNAGLLSMYSFFFQAGINWLKRILKYWTIYIGNTAMR